jgi:hypothetical protein
MIPRSAIIIWNSDSSNVAMVSVEGMALEVGRDGTTSTLFVSRELVCGARFVLGKGRESDRLLGLAATVGLSVAVGGGAER